MPRLTTDIQLYLHEVLGIAIPGVKAWAGADALPYFLRDAFEFSEIELLGQPIVLAEGRADSNTPLSDIRTWMTKVSATAGRQAVYVTNALASYERKRLIAHKIPFIVPGNQLYLPDLGIDLREYFRQRTPVVDALSPSAQAMLVFALLRQPWNADWQPAETASTLGYTAMTVSRAVKELTAVGLATVRVAGRARVLRMEGTPGDGLKPAEGSKLTPIPLDEAVASLSAILLDETYYAFIVSGRREADGLPWVGEDRLIPLKAVAWLELSARKERGEPVDAKDVRKHLNDVLRLSQLLAANTRIEIDARIAGDLTKFLAAVASDRSIDPGALQLG